MFFSNSFKRVFAHSVLTLFVVFTVLFVGCKQEPDDDYIDDHIFNDALIGTWKDTSAGDGYIIENRGTKTSLSYDYGGGYIGYAGTIRYVAHFNSSKTAGVIIFEYDPDNKQTYYDSFDNYGDPDHEIPLKGDYIGVYYKNLKPGVSVQIGTAYAEGGPEEPTLWAAIKAFTEHKEGDYMSYYGIYTK